MQKPPGYTADMTNKVQRKPVPTQMLSDILVITCRKCWQTEIHRTQGYHCGRVVEPGRSLLCLNGQRHLYRCTASLVIPQAVENFKGLCQGRTKEQTLYLAESKLLERAHTSLKWKNTVCVRDSYRLASLYIPD